MNPHDCERAAAFSYIPDGASGYRPTRWPRQHRAARVLVEVPGLALGSAVERNLVAEGYDVSICGGPGVFPQRRCPLVTSGHCPAAEGADVIVFALDARDPEQRLVLEAHRSIRPEALLLAVTGDRDEGEVETFRGCELIPAPLTVRNLASALRSFLPPRPEEAGECNRTAERAG
jgi:hypothetical protein